MSAFNARKPVLSRNRRARHSGFTLIEMLTVIFLIAFMLAFIAVVYVNYTKAARVRAAQAQIKEISMVLAQYYADMREYPPDSGFGEVLGSRKGQDEQGKSVILYDSGTLWRYLGHEVTKYVIRDDGSQLAVGKFGPYIKFRTEQLKEYDDFLYGKSYVVVDPWYHPIGYIGDPRRKIHNRDNVDLFSCGPDGKTAAGTMAPDGTMNPDGIDHRVDPPEDNFPCKAYQTNATDSNGIYNNAPLLGIAKLNGCLTSLKKNKNIDNKDKTKNEVLDDINNWDPQ